MQPRLRPGARRREDVITPASCKRYRSSKVLARRFYVPREGRRLRLPDPDRPPGSEFTLDKAFAQLALYAGIIKARSSLIALSVLGRAWTVREASGREPMAVSRSGRPPAWSRCR